MVVAQSRTIKSATGCYGQERSQEERNSWLFFSNDSMWGKGTNNVIINYTFLKIKSLSTMFLLVSDTSLNNTNHKQHCTDRNEKMTKS